MNITKCVKANNGKTYCWDIDNKCFVEVDTTKIETKDVPLDVIEKLMEAKQ
jgi:hypothetical protein